ncbi:MAG TPA: hypothetical protein VJV78_47880, partial [Polyangiales bacterium]|nr:hypothetical protein [Polyangiales bacterium]
NKAAAAEGAAPEPKPRLKVQRLPDELPELKLTPQPPAAETAPAPAPTPAPAQTPQGPQPAPPPAPTE